MCAELAAPAIAPQYLLAKLPVAFLPEPNHGTPADVPCDGGAFEANDSKHASLADSNRFAGRGICVECEVLLPGRQAPATCKDQLTLRNHALLTRRVLRKGTFFSKLFPRALPRQSLFHSAFFTRL